MTQELKPLGFVMADGIADALFGRRKGAASCPACAGVGFHFFDCALSPLTPEKPQASNAVARPRRDDDGTEHNPHMAPDRQSDWNPLIKLVGHEEVDDFMLVGNDGDLMLYKHIDTRRYLNINRISGRTFKFVACDRGYTAIPHDEALAYVRS